MKIDGFLQELKQGRRYSEHTVKSYINDLRQFIKYCDSSFNMVNINDVSKITIRSWISDLLDEGVSSRTVHRKISSLNRYFNFLISQQELSINPAKGIPLPKMGKRIPEFVSSEDMKLLIENIQTENSFEGLRNKLVVMLFYLTGMRRAELMELKHNDIDVLKGSLKVIGKGNKQRIIPLSFSMKNMLSEYIQFKENNKISEHFLFVTVKGSKMYPKLIYRVVNEYLSKVTTIKKKSPHVLRHTFATHMLNNGADINAIKEILGHANLSATEIYTHNSFEKLKSVYKQAHPRAQNSKP